MICPNTSRMCSLPVVRPSDHNVLAQFYFGVIVRFYLIPVNSVSCMLESTGTESIFCVGCVSRWKIKWLETAKQSLNLASFYVSPCASSCVHIWSNILAEFKFYIYVGHVENGGTFVWGKCSPWRKSAPMGPRNFPTFLQFLTATLFSSEKEFCVAWGNVVYLYKDIE